MKLPRRKFLHLAAGVAALPAVSRFARAQDYPSRPITMIVPFAPGGLADVTGRIMAEGKFDACYLFVDDVENIVKNGKTDLRQFAAQLGGALLRAETGFATAT